MKTIDEKISEIKKVAADEKETELRIIIAEKDLDIQKIEAEITA